MKQNEGVTSSVEQGIVEAVCNAEPERTSHQLYRKWKGRISIPERSADPSYVSLVPDPLPSIPPQYNRLSEHPLGDPRAPLDDEQPRCFNCGELGHRLQECWERRNGQRIAQARIEFEAASSSSWSSVSGTSSVNQRLQMLRMFAPGEVRGTALRDALGMHDFQDRGHSAPWMANIAIWGYPPGWHASYDPMAYLQHHVSSSEVSHKSTSFFIYSDEDAKHTELVDLGRPTDVLGQHDVMHAAHQRAPSDRTMTDNLPPRRRWAAYPFDDELPVYTSLHLPSVGISIPTASRPLYTSLQPTLWHPLLPPPPPNTPPPPLPPSSPPPPLLLLDPTPAAHEPSRFLSELAEEGEADMDMSSDSD